MSRSRFRATLVDTKNMSTRSAVILASVFSLLIFLTTLQLAINGSSHPYTTDVGEIQNALPRWGTLHFSGYPQFSFLGSSFVTIVRFLGVSPAAGSSLFSSIWGAVSIGLLTYLATMFKVRPVIAGLAALLFALSTSYWVDASIAEVHTLTLVLSLSAIISALGFGRSGKKRDLYLFAFFVGQGIAHQRAFGFLGFGLLLLILPQWRVVVKNLPLTIGLFLIGPLSYIYLPIRAWLGAEWTFNAPGTWDGFWSIVLDNKAGRIVELPSTSSILSDRVRGIGQLLADEWPWPLLITGLLGLLIARPGIIRRERFSLNLFWIPYLLVSFIIWIGRVGEAVLAINLMIMAIAALGISLILQDLSERWPVIEKPAIFVTLLLILFLFFTRRTSILEITRDPSAEKTIERVNRLDIIDDPRPTTLMALEGNDYWQLAYAQEYEGTFPDLNLVDHTRNFNKILEQGDRLVTLSRTFYRWPLDTWEGLLGPVYLSSAAPGIVEIKTTPAIWPESSPETPEFYLENGIAIQKHRLTWLDDETLLLEIMWRAEDVITEDFSIAVHLTSADPPEGPDDIISQADRTNPVFGWYPTSHWNPGELVLGHYLLAVPPESSPTAVRISMYQQMDDGSFDNTPWLLIPIP